MECDNLLISDGDLGVVVSFHGIDKMHDAEKVLALITTRFTNAVHALKSRKALCVS
jgi:hypothetical protein